MSVYVPAVANDAPIAGVYVNVPATLAVALSCVDDNGSLILIGSGVAQVTTGVALVTVINAVRPITEL